MPHANTVTDCASDLELPNLSIAFHSIIVLPSGNDAVALLVIFGDVSIIPVAVACPICIDISNAVAFTTISAGMFSCGGDLSTTVIF